MNTLPATGRATPVVAPGSSRSALSSVPCTVALSHTSSDFYAHVVLEGVDVGPGDQVLVHDAPTHIEWGQQFVAHRQASVLHAGWLARAWTRLTARFELTMLFEVSFSENRLLTQRHAARRRAANSESTGG